MEHAELKEMFTYHAPGIEQIAKHLTIREKALELAEKINALVPDCADKSAAIRKLRECVMTANAAIAINESGKES